MHKNQILLIFSCLAIALALFLFGKRNLTLKEALVEQKATIAKADTTQAITLDFNPIIESVKSKLPATQLDSIAQIEQSLSNASSKEDQLKLTKDLAKLWAKTGYIEVAAHYQKATATLSPSSQEWGITGDQYATAFRIANDSTLLTHYMDNAIQAYEKAVELEPENLDYKINLAACYIDGKGEVMQGVFMLRDVTTKDSTNVRANLILGRLALVSGQLTRSVRRLRHVIKGDPKNAEAYFYLGEALMGLDQKEEAVQTFNQCKKLVKNPAFLKEIEQRINHILTNK